MNGSYDSLLKTKISEKVFYGWKHVLLLWYVEFRKSSLEVYVVLVPELLQFQDVTESECYLFGNYLLIRNCLFFVVISPNFKLSLLVENIAYIVVFITIAL